MSIDISRLGKAAQAQILKQLRENEKRKIEREQATGNRHQASGDPSTALRRSPSPASKGGLRGENKLHAEKTADGYDSKREAKRAAELRLMEKAGEISNLREQVEYDLLPAVYEREDGHGYYSPSCRMTKASAEKIAGCKLKLVERGVSYVSDFTYQKDGHTVVEDAKGYRNPSSATYKVFVLKRKLMFYKYGIRVQEV